ncbi:MAG: DUF5671 domain-containing protein [Candidatus Magasanikbacteria bacterium]|nr:DUF5671 domain-containing protein [Candidatus Magasanikbacteria bacterium]
MENTSNLHSGPKDVFLHLFNIVTFYLTIIGFITLYIQYINAAFPDALNYYFQSIAGAVRISSSILFISVPAYLLSSWLLAADLRVVPQKRDFKLRKWLLYFTLFISAIIIIIDLITFIYNFLSGELTIQFFLKILVVLAVAGAVFGYYIWELKREDLNSKVPKMLAIILAVLTIVSVGAGFFVVGSPATQRNRRFDDQRVSDLQNLQGQVVNYWTQKAIVPAKLSDLQDSISGFRVPSDPETGAAYEYRIIDKLNFELCASFKTSGPDVNQPRSMIYSPNDPYSQNWAHKAERTCFDRTIDPELYKSQLPVVPVK